MEQQLKNSILFALLCIFSLGLGAQEKKVKKATDNYDDYAYVDARTLYLKLAKDGATNPEVYSKLGDSYYFTAEYTEAAKWYGKLLTGETDSSLDPEYYFRYAQSLKSIELYDLADEQMEKFNELNGTDSRALKFSNDRNYLKDIEAASGRYSLSKVSFNSDLQDFGPSFYKDSLVFSSNRKNVTGEYNHDWNDQPFLDLFLVENPTTDAPGISKLSKVLNTPYHESTSVFTKNGDVMYFTRNNYTKKKLRKDGSGTTKLKLYRSVYDGGKWSKAEELPFNSDDYSTAHPTLSPDENTLYFASDRPGTRGLSDLWRVAILDDGGFGEPVNLGDVINTEGRETFPHVTSAGQLFYASDGHSGLGGLDIFTSDLNENVTTTTNVGKPLNSSKDDFGLILNDENGLGYFSSNRSGGLGNDDIYAVKREIIEIPPCLQTIAGVTRDVKTNEIIPGATVELKSLDNEVLGTQVSDAQGNFSFANQPCETPFALRASKDKYDPSEASVSTGVDPDGVTNKDLFLQPLLRLEVGQDLGKILNLNPIYFDFDKAYIRPDAAYELQKVIAVMNEYPTLKIDVRSHTDSRGRDSYNLDLSQRRNVSTREYINQTGGISTSRLSGKGYGETQPTNQCSNGVKCSEEEHQLNRRSEFIIIER
jgi:outer membrane protein OmpA-like peptidoglycan-associated protein